MSSMDNHENFEKKSFATIGHSGLVLYFQLIELDTDRKLNMNVTL